MQKCRRTYLLKLYYVSGTDLPKQNSVQKKQHFYQWHYFIVHTYIHARILYVIICILGMLKVFSVGPDSGFVQGRDL